MNFYLGLTFFFPITTILSRDIRSRYFISIYSYESLNLRAVGTTVTISNWNNSGIKETRAFSQYKISILKDDICINVYSNAPIGRVNKFFERI